MSVYDVINPLTLDRKRNQAGESASLKRKRPDLCITVSRALLFKGEDKTESLDLRKAIEELGTKMSNWGAAFHGEVSECMLQSICSACCSGTTILWIPGEIFAVLCLCWKRVSALCLAVRQQYPQEIGPRIVHDYTCWEAAHHCSRHTIVPGHESSE